VIVFDNFFVSCPGGLPQGPLAPPVNPACFKEGGVPPHQGPPPPRGPSHGHGPPPASQVSELFNWCIKHYCVLHTSYKAGIEELKLNTIRIMYAFSKKIEHIAIIEFKILFSCCLFADVCCM
jgi:hypothetical protein